MRRAASGGDALAGVLEGAGALLANHELSRLKKLDLHHHYLSPAMETKLREKILMSILGWLVATLLAQGPSAGGAALLVQLAQVEGYAALVGYVLRCLQEGGPRLRALVDQGRVMGVVTGDKGRGRDGEELSTFEPGAEVQAQAILELRLSRLAALERRKIEDEYTAVIKEIGYLEDLLANPAKILGLIKEDLKYLKQKYGDPRRTRIVPI